MFSPFIECKQSSHSHPSPIYHRINIFRGPVYGRITPYQILMEVSRASKTRKKPGGRDVMRPTHDGPSLPNSAYRHPANM